MRDRIHLYCILWNEAFLLPYFFRHYDSFVDRYFFYDQASTDRTREMILGHPRAMLREQWWEGVDDCKSAELHSQEYKGSRGKADWVILADIDEFIVYLSGSLPEKLAELKEKGSQAVIPYGYQMISASSPSGNGGPLTNEIKEGVSDEMYAKFCIFDPEIDVRFQPGRHSATPAKDTVVFRSTNIRLLHYRYLGADYTRMRNARHHARTTQKNRESGYAAHVAPDYRGRYDTAWYEWALRNKQAVV